MPKWLRSRFPWQFSLIRLVLATLFLGTFVGLNLYGPLLVFQDARIWGFPLPVFTDQPDAEESILNEHVWGIDLGEVALGEIGLGDGDHFFILPAIMNVCLALLVLFHILFLHIPHRKTPAPKSNES